jgi:hypothetical protein
MMKRLTIIVLVLCIIARSDVRRSSAAPLIPTTYALSCNSITVSGPSVEVPLPYLSYVNVEVYDFTAKKDVINQTIYMPTSNSQPYQFTLSFTAAFGAIWKPGDTLVILIYDNNLGFKADTGITIPPCPESPCPIFTDGRLNDCDAGQTAAVYCQSNGSVEVKAIYKGEGYPAFTASEDEIAKVPTHPAKNTLIKSGNGAFLYRLTSGLLQVNRAEDGTGKVYSFKFGCGS